MAAIWPLALPQKPQRSGYSKKIPNNLIRSDMDTGPAKVRRRGGAKPEQVTGTYILTSEQLAVLETFVKETIAGGALCFDYPHPQTGAHVRARLVGGSDSITEAQLWGNTNALQVTLTIEYWPDAPLT